MTLRLGRSVDIATIVDLSVRGFTPHRSGSGLLAFASGFLRSSCRRISENVGSRVSRRLVAVSSVQLSEFPVGAAIHDTSGGAILPTSLLGQLFIIDLRRFGVSLRLEKVAGRMNSLVPQTLLSLLVVRIPSKRILASFIERPRRLSVLPLVGDVIVGLRKIERAQKIKQV